MRTRRIKFGAESGSDRMLKIYNKQATVEHNQKAIDLAHKFKIPISASFMHGHPLETEADIKATKDFIKKNKGKLYLGGWYQFRSFCGTKFYDEKSPLNKDTNIR